MELDSDTFLIRMARPVLERAQPIVADADAALLLADDQARMLLRYLSDPGMRRLFDKTHAVPGAGYSEAVLGTNGIGTALREKRLFRVSAFEHPAPCVQPFTATGVPILDPLTGHACGAVTIVCSNEREDLAMSVLVRQVAEAIERRFLEHSSERERALLEAFLRAGDLPCRLPDERTGLFLHDLPRVDRLVLEEKAVEMIALGQRAAIEIMLSGGRVAILRAVPATEPAGAVGVVAQVRIQGGPWEPLAGVPVSAIPDLGNSPALLGPAAPLAAKAMAGSGVGLDGGEDPESTPVCETSMKSQAPADPWLFLFGEPTVGKLAASARRRIRLLYEAAMSIGKTLDVVRTAEELAEVMATQFADSVTVDLDECVLRGEETTDPVMGLRRVAVRGMREELSPVAVGEPIHYVPSCPQADSLLRKEAVLRLDPRTEGQTPASDATPRTSGRGICSVIAVPLLAHDSVLGLATFMRSGQSEPFEEDDVSLAEELVGRAAICVDNARRFTRERAMAAALQRSMLPRSLPEQTAIEVAHRYIPAQAAAGFGWFDVIGLSGARVALVVGDVAGRGLRGAATMGRLRTAVGNFAALDMPPAEILGHLDDLVRRLSREEADQAGSQESHLLRDIGDIAAASAGDGVTGTTCVYTVYDPTSQHCAIASAGHPAPAVVYPDGVVEFLDVPTGQPLGLGGPPFETAEVKLPEGSRLVLYTKGLLTGDREIGTHAGLEQLRLALGRAARWPNRRRHRAGRPDPGAEA
ncbi:SpoIIE family protein phosphatase [Nonomuraea sp. 10N515B]|uniref:SpoIIE family protein phosphatase n=1 Tax=Nonomuraea sp. 10N515B TaxID=3457422 RepID=UPI003FCC8E2A